MMAVLEHELVEMHIRRLYEMTQSWDDAFSKYFVILICFDSAADDERVLCGGTNFDAPTEYVNKRKFDGHLVLTDGYAPKPKRSTCKRMWLIPNSCKDYLYFKTNEKILFVEGC